MTPPGAARRRRRGLLAGACVLALGLLPVAPVAADVSAPVVENAVTAENALPGTDTWRLGRPGFRTADDVAKQIKGYASDTSVDVGESIDLKVSVSPAQPFRVELYRLGHYQGHGARLVTTIGPLPGFSQPSCPVASDTGLAQCAWTTSHRLVVPESWTSGIYLGLLTNEAGFQNYLQFVVRDDDRPAPLLYQQSVMNYQAYNNYPADGASCSATPATGKNLYDTQSSPPLTVTGRSRAAKVSFDRPYACDGAGELLSPDWSWEHYFIRWLERSGYDVTYSTNVDTHRAGAELLDHRGFLSVGHDEYWTSEMYDAAERARDSGVNLAFFGANDVYWQSRLEPSSTGVRDRVMVVYKNTPNNTYTTNDPHPDPAQRTVRFQDPPVNRPAQDLMGVTFWSSSARSTWHTDLEVVNDDHWVYDGTGLVEGSSVSGIIGYEVDAPSCHYARPENLSYTVLSRSPFTDSRGLTQDSSAVVYQAPSGAWVFAAGTMSWSWGLSSKVDPRNSGVDLEDSRLQAMTANLLDVFTGEKPAGTAPTTPLDCSVDRRLSFEGGSLTGTTGADRTIGTVHLEASAPLSGDFSARIPNAAQSYLDSYVTPVDELDVSFQVELRALPTVDVRMLVVSNLVDDVGTLVLRAATDGTTRLQLRNRSVRVGAESGPLVTGQSYVVRLRQVRGVGADAVLQAHVHPAGATPSGPFAALSNGAWTTRADHVRIGSTTNSATTPPLLDAVIDEIVLVGRSGSVTVTPPAAPSGVSAVAVGSTRVDVRWDEVPGASGHVLERSTGGTDWATVAVVGAGATGASDTGAQAGTTYSYRVRATNVHGSSPPSESVTVTTPSPPPAALTDLVVTAVAPGVQRVSWTVGTPAAGVELQRSADPAFPAAGTAVFTLPSGTTEYEDSWSGVAWYRARAVTGDSWSDWSAVGSGPRLKDMTFEGGSLTGPLGATRVGTASTVLLESAAPLRGTGSARVPMGSAVAYLEETFPAVDELFVSFTVRQQVRGTVDVRLAQLLHGSGSSAVTSGALLLRANGTLLLRNYNTTVGTGVVLQPGTTYRVGLHERRTGAGTMLLEAYLAVGDAPFGAPFASTPSTPLSTSTGIGTARIGATTNGGLDALLDDISLDTTYLPGPVRPADVTPPAAPSGVSAVAVGSTRVDVRWDEVPGASGHVLERSTGGTDWATVAVVGAGATGASDTGAQAGTTYSYRVRATNVHGSSPPSESVTVTTPSPPPAALTDLVVTAVAPGVQRVSWTVGTPAAGVELQRSADPAFPAAGTAVFTLPSGTTEYEDSWSGVAWYRARAVTGDSWSDWSAVGSGPRLKDMTFEGGSLTGPLGATRVGTASTVLLESAAPLRGTGSARVPMGSAVAYLEETFPAVDELFVSFTVRQQVRGTVDVRLAQLLHGSGSSAVTSGSVLLRANGTLLLRNYNTTVGTGVVLQPGTTYRVGLHERRTGAGTMLLEAYLAVGDAPFGAPFASTPSTPLSTSTGIGTARIGATTNGGLDALLDDISLDTTYLPRPWAP